VEDGTAVRLVKIGKGNMKESQTIIEDLVQAGQVNECSHQPQHSFTKCQ
jgi:hypothetical protein